jgi:hypothetical protein
MPGTCDSRGCALSPPSVELHSDGSFDLSLGNVAIRRCYPGIDHEPLRPLGVRVDADSIVYDLGGRAVRLTFTRSGSMLEIRSRLEGFAAAPRWFAPICGGRLDGVERMYRTGVGFSGPSNIVPLAAEKSLVSYDSYLATGLIAADGACMALAAPDQRRFVQQTRVANRQVRGNFRNRELRENDFLLEASYSTEGIRLDGEALDLPPIVLAGGARCWDALRDLGRRIAADRSVRLTHRPCYHCCTWYRRGPFLTLGDLEAALDSAVQRGAEFRYVQIDDGYAPFAGDWLEADESKWPGGLPRALEAIRARGFRPGIWVAPFMVASRSRLFGEHPDWVLRGRDGQPVVQWRSDLGERASEEHYALDSSHPQALEYVRHVFQTLRGWGAEFFKTDFMEWGFPDPDAVRRHAPGRTSADYFDEVGRTIRNEIGEAYWLGCITYFAPSVGYVDGMRVSSDCGGSWPDDDPPGPDGAGGGTQNVVSETLGCHWMNGLLWQNDPDVTFLRRNFIRLRDHERDALAWWHGILGVSVNTSDWVAELDADGLALWRFLRPADRPWTADLPFWEDHFGASARRPVYTVVRKFDHGGWAVLWLNPTGREQVDRVTAAELTGREELFAYAWSHRGSERLGPHREFVTALGPHHARLVSLSAEDQPPPAGLTLGGGCGRIVPCR